MAYNNIPKEKFRLVNHGERISDKKFDTKAVGSFMDAMIRFKKNKSSVVAAFIILFLFLFAIITPLLSNYDVNFRDGYYKMVLPKSKVFSFLGWDGCKEQQESQAGYEYLNAIGMENGSSAVKKVKGTFVDETSGKTYYKLYVDTYEKVGFTYVDLTQDQYTALKNYQNETGIQVIYPMPDNYNTVFVSSVNGANLWYQLENDTPTTTGISAHHDENGNPVYVNNYKTGGKNYGKYDSIRIPGDDGTAGEDGDEWYVYAIKNQTGFRVRVLYSEYYQYVNGFEPSYLLGTNQHGQDILVCLASGAQLSFLLAISVSLLNLIIGVCFGAVEGYYGGVIDLLMERFRDVLSSVPFIVVATLFQLHLAEKVGPIPSLLFAFVLTGWIGIAGRVRTQFYRFKGQEYILAARTLGASDARLIFRHILPNSLGTIITGTILIIPGVIFSESMLTYLGIVNLETSGLTSIGTMLANGKAYLSTFPHIIACPAVFISLLEISFNLFGNGLRDAFNPSLRGADE